MMRLSYIPDLVKATGVQPGEKILIHFWGENRNLEIANAFVEAVTAAGATPLLLQQSRTANYDRFRYADTAPFPDDHFEQFSSLDAVLDVFAYRPVVLGYPLEEPQMALYRSYMARLFKVLLKAKRFTQIRMPTAANAEESGLPVEEFIYRMESAYATDYCAVRERCAAMAAQRKLQSHLCLHTGQDHRLFFDLSGRDWHIDAGDGDLPCGEVYIAPQESQTRGSIFFPTLFLEDVGKFLNVTLFAENGRLTGSDCEAVQQFIESLSPEETVICELGFGLNPNVTELCGYPVLDEKMDGSFHIAIGANHMFGGENRASLHMDFVHPGPFHIESIP